MVEARTGDETTRPRVILLGASNVTRGFSIVLETARLIHAAPIDLCAAIGHGRSYGIDSRFLGRTLPGIVQCGLWDALEQRSPAPTCALVTDIGNDVMYGVKPEQIAAWVEVCLDRLLQMNARIVITAPPIDGIRAVRAWQYAIVRTALFPTRRLSMKQAVGRAEELARLVHELARTRELPLIEPEPAWYGFDPIHIRGRFWPDAWMSMLSRWIDDAPSARARRSLRRWLRLRLMRQHRWKLVGKSMRTAQPAGRLPDGTTISLY